MWTSSFGGITTDYENWVEPFVGGANMIATDLLACIAIGILSGLFIGIIII